MTDRPAVLTYPGDFPTAERPRFHTAGDTVAALDARHWYATLVLLVVGVLLLGSVLITVPIGGAGLLDAVLGSAALIAAACLFLPTHARLADESGAEFKKALDELTHLRHDWRDNSRHWLLDVYGIHAHEEMIESLFHGAQLIAETPHGRKLIELRPTVDNTKAVYVVNGEPLPTLQEHPHHL